MILQVGKGAVLILTDSEWEGMQDRDVIIHKEALVVIVPDDSTIQERVEAYRDLREDRDV